MSIENNLATNDLIN